MQKTVPAAWKVWWGPVLCLLGSPQAVPLILFTSRDILVSGSLD